MTKCGLATLSKFYNSILSRKYHHIEYLYKIYLAYIIDGVSPTLSVDKETLRSAAHASAPRPPPRLFAAARGIIR